MKYSYAVNIKYKHCDIAICIPSKNEKSTIASVTSTIDRGLNQHYPEVNCVIINIDSHSNDGTQKLFLDTPTRCKKVSLLSSKQSYTGKGINLHQFLTIASNMGVKCGVVIDADLESIAEGWIPNLIEPILLKNADFVAPLYSRHKYDATITNHLCVPIIFGEWGTAIRQPIGGEFSFSQKYIQSALNALNEIHSQESNLSAAVDRFGIDIFLTTHAIANNFEIYQSYLGQKVHRFREIRELRGMFLDVSFTLFQVISMYRGITKKHDLLYSPQEATPPLESDLCIEPSELCTLIASEVAALSTNSLSQYCRLIDLIQPNRPTHNNRGAILAITMQEWVVILKYFLNRCLHNLHSQDLIEALYPLFLARLVDHFSIIANLKYVNAEFIVQEQMKLMRD